MARLKEFYWMSVKRECKLPSQTETKRNEHLPHEMAITKNIGCAHENWLLMTVRAWAILFNFFARWHTK